MAELRLDLRTGSLSERGRGFRFLGEQLVDPLLRNPEVIERRVGGSTVWLRDLADLFDNGYSTDQGWDFPKFGNYYVGTLVHYRPGPAVRHSLTIDLAHDPLTASFSAQDGQLWWQEHGISVDCMGTLLPNAESPDPVRCRYSGTVTYTMDRSGHVKTTSSKLHVTIEGFDPLSSTATWSHPVGAAISLVDGSAPTMAVTDHEVMVRLPAGASVLNLTTGALRPVSAGETFWCQRQEPFAQVPAADPPHEGQVVTICDTAGHPATRLPFSVPSAVSAKGPRGLRLVSTPGAVVAYRG